MLKSQGLFLDYEVIYSWLYAAIITGPDGITYQGGLHVLANGSPYENYNLININPNGVFIIANDYNHITVCSFVASTKLTLLIIDYLN